MILNDSLNYFLQGTNANKKDNDLNLKRIKNRMSLRVIFTPNAPPAVGPYSQAVLVDNKFLYTAGQIPLHPQTNTIVGSTIKEQTEQALHNLGEILAAGGSSFKNVIKTTVFLQDMNDFAAMNEVYAKYFDTLAPSRSTVEVSRLPKDALVEIEVVAIVE
jgi:2-iminobutanoate/2-iminopropanoate deaminase